MKDGIRVLSKSDAEPFKATIIERNVLYGIIRRVGGRRPRPVVIGNDIVKGGRRNTRIVVEPN